MEYRTELSPGEEKAALWIWERLPQMPEEILTGEAIRALLYVAFRIRYGEAMHPGANTLPLRRVLRALEPPKTQLLAGVQAEIMSRTVLESMHVLTSEHEEIPYDPDEPAPNYENLVAETRQRVMSVPPETGISPELAAEIEQEGHDDVPEEV